MVTYTLTDIEGGPRTVLVRQYNDHTVSVRGLMRGLWHERSQSFDSEEEASKYLHRRIRGLIARGYGVGLRNLDLEARIAADPDDPGGYAVYADWLEEQEDARALLIRAQLMDADASATLAEHSLQLLPSGLDTIEWRYGFIRSVLVKRYHFEGRTPEEVIEDAAGIAKRLLRHPSGPFLARVEIASQQNWGQSAQLVGTWERNSG